MWVINTSNLVKGGALQVGCDIIINLIKSKNECYFLLNRIVYNLIKNEINHTTKYYIAENSPSRDMDERKKILKIVDEINPNLVFSVFGPSYIEFNQKHVMGCANPWVTHSSLEAFTSSHPIYKLPYIWAQYLYIGYWLRKADYWIFETDTSRKGFKKRLRLPNAKTFVVPNTYNTYFTQKLPILVETQTSESIEILYVAALYNHKNHKILVDITNKLIQKTNKKFKFILTIPDFEKTSFFKKIQENNLENYFESKGFVSMMECPKLYQKAKFCIMPSLLETFSANYPESMIMGKPIVCSDYSFSRDLCGDGALYCSSVDDYVDVLFKLIEDDKYYNKAVDNSVKHAQTFIHPKMKFSNYLDILSQIDKEL